MASEIRSYNFLIVEDQPFYVQMIKPQLDAIAEKVKAQWNISLKFIYTNTGADAINALQGKEFNQFNPDLYFVPEAASIQTEPTEFTFAIVDNMIIGNIEGKHIPKLSGNENVTYAFHSSSPMDTDKLLKKGFIYQLRKGVMANVMHMVAVTLQLK
ncbi:MAG: hypothetical protein JSS32_06285 [Verrucomicrobia bacterium]|nr:hypothetical protein [Verrucomicrobiota bacterium]